MKKILLFAVCLLTFVLCMSSSVLAAGGADVAVLLTAQNGEKISITHTDNVFYLPAAVDITKLSLTADGEITYTVGGKSGKLSSGATLDITPAKTTDARGDACYKLTLSVGGKSTDFTFYHDEALSSIYVTTSQGLSYIESNKANRDKDAKILVLSDDGAVEYSDIAGNTASEIKGRGNATWSYLKKPYQIKLSEKTALLGMEKAKTWILLAGYTDQSALHNALAFSLGDAIDIPYNIEYRFTNLYIDGEYRGLYMICEKVQIDSSRVDITELEKENENANPGTELSSFPIRRAVSGDVLNDTILKYYTYCLNMKSPADITGGYLVELDNIRGTSEPCHFQTENGNIYVVKSPEYVSKEEMEYIAVLFADMEEAIFSETGYNSKGVHYSEYIDMESFAGIYTLQELLKNWDAYLSSMFFFKDADTNGVRGKIYMGPLWDMDNTLGNINFNKEFGTDTAYLWAQDGVFQTYPRDFAKMLMTHTDFQAAVAKKYNEAYQEVQAYLADGGWFEESAELITASVTMDRTLWKLYDGNSWLLGASGRKSSVKFIQFEEFGTAKDESKDTALGFMRYYLSERAEALLLSIGSGDFPMPEETTAATTTTVTTTTTASSTTQTTAQASETGASGASSDMETTTQTETADCTEDTGAGAKESSPVGAIIIVVMIVAAGVIASVVIIKKKKK